MAFIQNDFLQQKCVFTRWDRKLSTESKWNYSNSFSRVARPQTSTESVFSFFFLSPIMTRSSGHKSSFSNYNNNINESYIEGTFQDQSNRWNECAMPWHRLNAINNLLQATCSCPTTDCARYDCGFPAASRCSTPYLLCVMFTRITRPLMQSFTQMQHTDKPI